jgi:hypothetical protein
VELADWQDWARPPGNEVFSEGKSKDSGHVSLGESKDCGSCWFLDSFVPEMDEFVAGESTFEDAVEVCFSDGGCHD